MDPRNISRPARGLRLWAALTLASAAAGLGSAAPAGERTLLFFGDSLTAGLGLPDPDNESYPARIQQKIDAAHLPWRVVNAGLSGETTAGGLRRVDWVLKQKVDLFVLELGGNDGLRGTAPDATQANLQGIIDHVRARYPSARIVLAGMRMPDNMGADYTAAFRAIYPLLAKRNGVPLIPFLLDGVAGHRELNQYDGIHPTAEGAAIVADEVWKMIHPMLLDIP
jgi:acyl-CoA thioesterase-1